MDDLRELALRLREALGDRHRDPGLRWTTGPTLGEPGFTLDAPPSVIDLASDATGGVLFGMLPLDWCVMHSDGGCVAWLETDEDDAGCVPASRLHAGPTLAAACAEALIRLGGEGG